MAERFGELVTWWRIFCVSLLGVTAFGVLVLGISAPGVWASGLISLERMVFVPPIFGTTGFGLYDLGVSIEALFTAKSLHVTLPSDSDVKSLASR